MPYPFPVFRMMTMNLTHSIIGPLACFVRPWKPTLPWLEYPADAFRKQCMFSVRKSHDAALNRRSHLLEQQQRWKLLLERENRSRMLLEPFRFRNGDSI
jgi:hypothetical protein